MPKARQQLFTPPRACSGNALEFWEMLVTTSHRWWDQWTQSCGLKSCFQFKWHWEVHILISFIKPSELPLWANQGGKWPKQSTKNLLTIMSVQNLHCIKNLGQGCCLGMVATFLSRLLACSPDGIRFGSVEFLTKEEANYAIKIMTRFKLYGKPIQIFISKQTKQNKEPNYEWVGQHLH